MSDLAVWKFLHDGCIESIDGAVPGDVVVGVSIRYVRERFPGEGTGFTVTLHGCTGFEYEPYDGPPCSDLLKIAHIEPEVLSLESESPLVVNCVMGTLRISCSRCSIALDTGGQLTLAQLEEAFRGYWEEWSVRSRRTT
jgi:hypothetical protein